MTWMSSSETPSPAPRPARSPTARSNTVTSQPALRNRLAAISPQTEPPITSTRLEFGVRVVIRALTPISGKEHRMASVIQEQLPELKWVGAIHEGVPCKRKDLA